MMQYWDTSALLACFIEEPETEQCRSCLGLTPDEPKFTSWLTLFEMETALRRKINQKLLLEKEVHVIQEVWNEAQSHFNFIPLDVRVARTGSRLQKLYNLKTGDGVQLGSAGILQLEYTEVQFVCLDKQLAKYAKQEGFLLPQNLV